MCRTASWMIWFITGHKDIILSHIFIFKHKLSSKPSQIKAPLCKWSCPKSWKKIKSVIFQQHFYSYNFKNAWYDYFPDQQFSCLIYKTKEKSKSRQSQFSTCLQIAALCSIASPPKLNPNRDLYFSAPASELSWRQGRQLWWGRNDREREIDKERWRGSL